MRSDRTRLSKIHYTDRGSAFADPVAVEIYEI